MSQSFSVRLKIFFRIWRYSTVRLFVKVVFFLDRQKYKIEIDIDVYLKLSSQSADTHEQIQNFLTLLKSNKVAIPVNGKFKSSKQFELGFHQMFTKELASLSFWWFPDLQLLI